MGGGIGPISIDIGTNKKGEADFIGSGGTITIGAKSPLSGHVSLGVTRNATLKDFGNMLLEGMSDVKNAIDQYVFENIERQILTLSQ
jgi:hypothetical protein